MQTEPGPSLDAIFSPRSVAVVGASRREGSIGFSILRNLLAGRFEGPIFPVNPNAGHIHSLKAYPSVEAVPDPVDLAVIVVPREKVPAAVEGCLAKGVRGLVVITAGFSETGAAGKTVEEELCRRVRSAGVRMVGPNCMGVINTDPAVSLDATFAPTAAHRGAVGFVSQSGALGVAILNVAAELGLGLSQFVSMGNKADVSGNDLLEYWEDDPETRVIAMYLESFGNPRRFTEIAKRVGRKKPILVVKSGRTAEGARAASSHTGAMAGADLTVSAFLEKCGVLRASSIEELFDLARAFDRLPLAAGPRVAIVTNAGGPAIMATDACVNLGLAMAELATATRQALGRFLPPEASLANPVDMIASADPESYRRTTASVLADPGVDMVMVIHVTPLLSEPIDMLESVAEAAAEMPMKPVLAVMMAKEEFYEHLHGRRDLPPVYRFPESAARALAQLRKYSAWRERPELPEVPSFAVDEEAVGAILGREEEGYLDPAEANRVLELYGIATARWRRAESRDAALAAAGEIGFPVVAKAIAAGLVHKSDLGAVAVGLDGPAALACALDRMQRDLTAAGHPPTGFLIQELAGGGHEVVFGISNDPRFGPLLMFGLGGRYVEVFQDVRFGVTPLERAEAEEMIRGIHGFPLLEGYRGEPGADLGRLSETLLRLAQLAQRHPEILELDINPFLAAPEASRAKALDVRIRVRGGRT